MTPKHTPGPWYVGEVHNNKITVTAERAPYGFVAEVNQTGPVCEANARLIAKAPEMRASLIAFMSFGEYAHNHIENDEARAGLVEMLADARALLTEIDGNG